VKKTCSIRLDDETKAYLVEEYGGVQNAVKSLTTDSSFCTVYKITNILNDKVYVGCTEATAKKRFDQHSKAQTELGEEIRELGKDSFKLEVIAKVKEKKEGLKLEGYFIEELNTIKNGYNSNRSGGGSTRVNTQFDEATIKFLEELSKELGNDVPNLSASVKFAVKELMKRGKVEININKLTERS